MNPEMQTTLLNTYPHKLIATILKALRAQLKESDQMNAKEEIASKEQPRDSLTSNFLQRIVRSMAKTKLADWSKSVYEPQDASHIWQFDYVNLICAELGGFRRVKHSAAWFQNPNQDVRTTLCVCQMTMDLNTSTVFVNPNTQRKTWEHWDSKIQT